MKKFTRILTFVFLAGFTLTLLACNNSNKDSKKTNSSKATSSNVVTTNPNASNTSTNTTTEAHVHQLEHNVAVEGNCTTKGTIEYWSCTCGKNFSDAEGLNEVDSLETDYKHNTTKHDGVPADYEKAGNIEYYVCSSCEKVFDKDGNEISLEDTVLDVLVFYPENREYDVLNGFEDTTSVDTYFFGTSVLSDDYALSGKSYNIKVVGEAVCTTLPILMKKNGSPLTEAKWNDYDYFLLSVYSTGNGAFYFLNRAYELVTGYNILKITKSQIIEQITSNTECYNYSTGTFWCQLTGTDIDIYLDELIAVLPEGVHKTLDYYPVDAEYIVLQNFDEAGSVDTYYFPDSSLSDDHAVSLKSFHVVKDSASWSALPIMVKLNGEVLKASDWNRFEYYKIYVYADSACTFAVLNKTFDLATGLNMLTITKEDMNTQLANNQCYNYESGWFWFQLNGTNVSVYIDELIGVLPEGICANHTLTHHEAQAGADCQTKGVCEYWTCDVCGLSFADNKGGVILIDDEGAFGPHTLTHHEAQSGIDCKHAGTIEYWNCSVCNKNFSDNAGTVEVTNLETTAGTHILTHHEAQVGANCQTKGTIEYWSCSACEKNFSDAAGANETTNLEGTFGNHDYENHPFVQGTNEADGNIEYYTCKTCSKFYILVNEEYTEVAEADVVIASKDYYPTDKSYDVLQDFNTGADQSVDVYFVADSTNSLLHSVDGKTFHVVKDSASWLKLPIMVKLNGNVLTQADWNKYDSYKISIYADSACTFAVLNHVIGLSAGKNIITISKAEMDAQLANASAYNYETGWFWCQLNGDNISIYLDQLIGIYEEKQPQEEEVDDGYHPVGRAYDVLQSFDTGADQSVDVFFVSGSTNSDDHAVSSKSFHVVKDSASWTALPIMVKKNGSILTNEDWANYEYFKISVYADSACTFALYNKTFDLVAGDNVLTISKADLMAQIAGYNTTTGWFLFQLNGSNISIYLDELIGVYPEGVDPEKIYFPVLKSYDVLQSFDTGANQSVDVWFVAGSDNSEDHAVSGKSFHVVKDSASWTALPIMVKLNGNILTTEDWNKYESFMMYVYADSPCTFALYNKTFDLVTGKNILTITKAELDAQIAGYNTTTGWFTFQLNGSNISIYLDEFIGIIDPTYLQKKFAPEGKGVDVLQSFDTGANQSVDVWFVAGSDNSEDHAVSGKSFHVVKDSASWTALPIMVKLNGNILTTEDWNKYESFMMYVYADSPCTFALYNKTFDLVAGENILTFTKAELDAQIAGYNTTTGWFLFQLNGSNISIYLDQFVGIYTLSE